MMEEMKIEFRCGVWHQLMIDIQSPVVQIMNYDSLHYDRQQQQEFFHVNISVYFDFQDEDDPFMYPSKPEEMNMENQGPLYVQSLGSIVRKSRQRVSHLNVDKDSRVLSCHVSEMRDRIDDSIDLIGCGIFRRILSYFDDG